MFGVGFPREHLKVSHARMIERIRAHHRDESEAAVEAFLARFEAATVDEKGAMPREPKAGTGPVALHKKERKGLRNIHRLEPVERLLLLRIAAAWPITVPATGAPGAMFDVTIRGAMLP